MSRHGHHSGVIGLLSVGLLGINVYTATAQTLTPLAQTRTVSAFEENFACQSFGDMISIAADDCGPFDEAVEVGEECDGGQAVAAVEQSSEINATSLIAGGQASAAASMVNENAAVALGNALYFIAFSTPWWGPRSVDHAS